MLSPVTFFNLIMAIIASLQVFAEPFVLTKGGPNNSTLLLSVYLYQNAFQHPKMGLRLRDRLGHLRDHLGADAADLPLDADVGALRGR